MSGERRRVALRASAVAFVSALCCLLAAPGPVVAADAPPLAVGQDVTLDGLGIGAQTVHGAHGATDVAFPPAVTHLASTGSFVRVFFSHSPDVAAGSSMLIAVDAQPLLTVALSPGTAGGGVVETRLPPSLLADGAPNRLQVRFTLTGPAATLYGRVDGETTMHYELAPLSGQPDLAEYPYTLLAAGVANPALGVVLPVTPDPQDLAAAFRVVADVGRRAASQRVLPQVITAGQADWLAAGGVGAVLVGRVDSLPAAGTVLDAAGWKWTSAGWTAPDGRVLGRDEGLVLGVVSPWDHRTPLLLVTGGTSAAVARGASALVSGPAALTGQYVVVTDATPTDITVPPRQLRVSVLSPRDLASFGSGRYRAAVSFTAPAVDPDDTAVLELTIPALGAVVPSGTVEADVNGTWVAATALDAAGDRPTRLVASFSGRLLRPGRNALSLEFRIEDRTGRAPAAADELTPGVDAATAALSLPDPAPAAGDLRLLPFPFLEGGHALQVVLADGTVGTLGAGAQAMAALGARSTQPPPSFKVAFATGWNGSGEDHLVVVGRPPPGSAVEAIGAHLPVVFERTGGVTVGGSGGRVRLDTSVGAVEELRTSDAGGRQVLWLAGTATDALSAAARSLYDPSRGGTVATVDPGGRLSFLGPAALAAAGLGPSTAQVAGGLAAALILALVCLQLLRPRRRRP